jgi:hypothetical protein
MRSILIVVFMLVPFSVSVAGADCSGPDCVTDPPVKAGKGRGGVSTFREGR